MPLENTLVGWLIKFICTLKLFEKDTDTVGLHLKNIYSSGELDEISTTEESSVIQLEAIKKSI